MEKEIKRYLLRNDLGEQSIKMPKKSKVLSLKFQDNILSIVALVTPGAEKKRFFFITKIGETIDTNLTKRYIGCYGHKQNKFRIVFENKMSKDEFERRHKD